MPRLPIPGEDNGTWGSLLNEFLSVEHDSSGNLAIRTDGTFDTFVHKSGTETITGTKSFTSSPVVPTPTNNTDATNKTYVDTAVSNVVANDTIHVLKSGDTMSGDLVSTGSISASGPYSPVPTTPGVYLGTPSTLNPRFTIVPTSGSVRAIDNSGGALRIINSTGGTVQLISDGNGLFTFGSATSPTHTLTLPSTTTGIALYNTADQTTNYERLRMYWNASEATIRSEAGGTGNVRGLTISQGNVSFRLNDAGSPKFLFVGATTAGIALSVNETVTFTSGSIVQTAHAIQPTINQSGTAGYTGLLVNPTETAVGSGIKRLADFQVGGTSKANIDNNGYINAPRLYVNSTAYLDGTTAGTIAASGSLDVVGGNTTNMLIRSGTGTDYRQTFRIVQGSALYWLWGDGTTEDQYLNFQLNGGKNLWNNKGRDFIFSSTANAQIMTLAQSTGYVGLGTQSPTHTLTFASTTTGTAHYNTTDQTTNFERARMYWTGNVFTITTDQGGTGLYRDLRVSTANALFINSGTTAISLINSSTTAKITVTSALSAQTGIYGQQHVSSFNGTSGVQTALAITPTYTQTGTAGYTGLLVNSTETTTGSGAKLLIHAQLGGVDRFRVANNGDISPTGSLTLPSGRIAIATGATLGDVPTALLDIGASTTARANLRLRAGVAPTAPNDGDIWFDGADIKVRINGVTKTFTLA